MTIMTKEESLVLYRRLSNKECKTETEQSKQERGCVCVFLFSERNDKIIFSQSYKETMHSQHSKEYMLLKGETVFSP